MKTENLIPFLDAFAASIEQPLAAVRDNQLIYMSEAGAPYAYCLSVLYESVGSIWDGRCDLFQIVSLEQEEGMTILLGPLTIQRSDREAYIEVLRAKEPAISLDQITLLAEWLSRKSLVSLTHLEKMKEALLLAVDGRQPDGQQVSQNSQPVHMPEKEEVEWASYNSDYVQQLEQYVRMGAMDEMEALMRHEIHAPYGSYADDQLRHFKNSMMVHIYIMSRAAMEGGLEDDLCMKLAERYSRQCEQAASVSQLREISIALRLDFCRRVNHLKQVRTDSQTVNRAIAFIHTHRMEKLNASMIAAACGVSASYLCMEFKARTGKSIVAFINEEKIAMAKELLSSSDRTLIDIASYLSFSSQNYFQTVFRKYAGMSPGQYRSQFRTR
ncbi:MAG: helix-turn-helix transcriptional regulator [Solobacterium sp.]|nr:helix-turn-helix transcriptional regulator [Solobacterium sp.]